MAMTATEMIGFFSQQADRTRLGMTAAQSTADYQLAAVNCRQAFKCRLMQGLISWRSKSDPKEFLESAVLGLSEDWETLQSTGGEEATLKDTPAEKAAFLSYLIGQDDLPLPFDTDLLESDRLLDAVLGTWLFGTWDDSLWERGIGQLRQSGSDLAVETYCLYREFVQASSAQFPTLMKVGEDLFGRRRSDKFFTGGDQTEGGGDDNSLTVDYRLGSLSKRAGFVDCGIHAWVW